jgi:threonine/homoserine/homoserine lactone efflux protein
MKKNSKLGVIYILIAALFALSAVTKTISNHSIVLAMQWLCAIVFVVLGVWQLTRKGFS